MTISYYLSEVQKLKTIGRELNVSEEEIEKIIDDSFKFLHVPEPEQKRPKKLKYFTIGISLALIAVLSILIITHRKAANNYVHRNIQELIYPGMRLLRIVTLPVVKTFPSLTEWYDEACLVSNPYFSISDLDCWPCEQVRSVLNLTMASDTENIHSGIPFVIYDKELNVTTFKALQTTYLNKKEMFDRDSRRVESNGNWYTSEDVFKSKAFNPTNLNGHIKWRLNRLEPTREIRLLFGMPKKIPNYINGITPEKFVLLDGNASPSYPLPQTEGTTVFVLQGSGTRLFLLEPSPECKSKCRKVSVVLKPQNILWYNWWYWRVRSVPVDSNEESITYIGSYY